jgi:hypothetical protein
MHLTEKQVLNKEKYVMYGPGTLRQIVSNDIIIINIMIMTLKGKTCLFFGEFNNTIYNINNKLIHRYR